MHHQQICWPFVSFVQVSVKSILCGMNFRWHNRAKIFCLFDITLLLSNTFSVNECHLKDFHEEKFNYGIILSYYYILVHSRAQYATAHACLDQTFPNACTMHNVHVVQCTMYNVQCTMYCTMLEHLLALIRLAQLPSQY